MKRERCMSYGSHSWSNELRTLHLPFRFFIKLCRGYEEHDGIHPVMGKLVACDRKGRVLKEAQDAETRSSI